MKTVGANPNPRAVGIDRLPGVTNYFIGNDPAKWRTNVTGYAKVKYEGVYPGIDLVYYDNGKGALNTTSSSHRAPTQNRSPSRLKMLRASKLIPPAIW